MLTELTEQFYCGACVGVIITIVLGKILSQFDRIKNLKNLKYDN